MLFEKETFYLLTIKSSHTNPKSSQQVPGPKLRYAEEGFTILDGEKGKEKKRVLLSQQEKIHFRTLMQG